MLPLYKKACELKVNDKELSELEGKTTEESEVEEDREEESSVFEDDLEEPLQVEIIEKNNPCTEMIYDPNRVEYRYQYEDESLIAIRKGICFKCSAYRSIIYSNLNSGYNSSQICEKCIQSMFDDHRN